MMFGLIQVLLGILPSDKMLIATTKLLLMCLITLGHSSSHLHKVKVEAFVGILEKSNRK